MARTKYADIPTFIRFLRYVSISDSGCWEWQGGCSKNGYGVFGVNKKSISSHRFSYIHYIGELEDGLYVCHKCDNKKCVNPFHLFSGTAKDNAQDFINKGLKRKNPVFKRVLTHPSFWLYTKGCRCDECVNYVREYSRNRMRIIRNKNK